jgi:protein-disulfide isomerase
MPTRSLLAALPIALLLSLPACKKPPSAAGTSPAASASAGAASCVRYATQMCEKAGAESEPCQALKALTDVMAPEACAAGLKNIDYSAKKIQETRGKCTELVTKLCEAVGPLSQTCTMITAQTTKMPPEQCKKMLEHLPEVIAEVQKMEQASRPLGAELQAALVAGPGASFGPANAKVQIVEFSDFQCPYCSRAADVVHQIKEKYGKSVHFVFRQFPLPMHPNAHQAAEAALEAGAQGKFWELHDKMFKAQQNLDRAGLEALAKEAGLNVGALKKALDDHKFAGAVDADLKLGEKVSIEGTPTIFINGARVANPTSFDEVSKLIDAALKG